MGGAFYHKIEFVSSNTQRTSRVALLGAFRVSTWVGFRR
ncbi:hypothetical protein I552_6590 [Mycobacterium xenopi 3993]|nr:hypothetical protein I552_6590 [Mycobacterium xenopi 3993]